MSSNRRDTDYPLSLTYSRHIVNDISHRQRHALLTKPRQKSIMDVLPLHFFTLRFFGLWYESSKGKHRLVKYIWRLFNVNAILLFTIAQLGALTIYRDNVSDFTECLFLSLTYVGLGFKLTNWLSRHSTMERLLDEFRRKICQPRDDHERKMLNRYRRIVAIVFNVHMGFAQFDNLIIVTAPLASMLAGNPEVLLPFKTYEIGDKNNRWYWWTNWLFQLVADTIGVFVNISFDTMLAGFLLLTCGQIDVCCHRFSMSSSRDIRESTRNCILHQLLIRKIVRKLEAFFMPVVLPLMMLSLITFCTSIYNLSQVNTKGVDSLSFVVYLACLICQLGCYCWFGNELKLKGLKIRDTIYNSDWTTLQPTDRKSLYLIMLSCQKETSISFHGLCTLTIDIFVWVLKTSYSAYNLLKTVDTAEAI